MFYLLQKKFIFDVLYTLSSQIQKSNGEFLIVEVINFIYQGVVSNLKSTFEK